MRATGIVRRIDELGRVVIPKEIRRTLRIREGDSLEIYTDRDGSVILRKYSFMGELGEFAGEYAESLRESTGYAVMIADKDRLVACSVGRRPTKSLPAVDEPVSDELENVIGARKRCMRMRTNNENMVPITRSDNTAEYTAQLILPVIASGDPVGAVILVSLETGAAFSEADIKVAETAAAFLTKQLEN